MIGALAAKMAGGALAGGLGVAGYNELEGGRGTRGVGTGMLVGALAGGAMGARSAARALPGALKSAGQQAGKLGSKGRSMFDSARDYISGSQGLSKAYAGGLGYAKSGYTKAANFAHGIENKIGGSSRLSDMLTNPKYSKFTKHIGDTGKFMAGMGRFGGGAAIGGIGGAAGGAIYGGFSSNDSVLSGAFKGAIGGALAGGSARAAGLNKGSFSNMTKKLSSIKDAAARSGNSSKNTPISRKMEVFEDPSFKLAGTQQARRKARVTQDAIRNNSSNRRRNTMGLGAGGSGGVIL